MRQRSARPLVAHVIRLVSALAENWAGRGRGFVPLTNISVLGDPIYIIGKASEQNKSCFSIKEIFIRTDGITGRQVRDSIKIECVGIITDIRSCESGR